MPSRFERHPPVPPSSTSGTAAIPLHPSQTSALETSPRRVVRPRDASIMPPVNGSTPKSSQHRGHSRSISNPFAGFGRKRDKTASKHATWDSDSDDDDEVTYPLEPESSSPRKGAASGNDMAEGKCQTCDATVRWPRHLKVFRCTDCLMITDLEPISHESRDNPPQGSQGGASKLANKGKTTKASLAS
jgi:E3 ubiquitin-protein ligase HECTD2